MSGRAIHTFVHKDRYNIKEKLGFPTSNIISVSRKLINESLVSNETNVGTYI